MLRVVHGEWRLKLPASDHPKKNRAMHHTPRTNRCGKTQQQRESPHTYMLDGVRKSGRQVVHRAKVHLFETDGMATGEDDHGAIAISFLTRNLGEQKKKTHREERQARRWRWVAGLHREGADHFCAVSRCGPGGGHQAG